MGRAIGSAFRIPVLVRQQGACAGARGKIVGKYLGILDIQQGNMDSKGRKLYGNGLASGKAIRHAVM